MASSNEDFITSFFTVIASEWIYTSENFFGFPTATLLLLHSAVGFIHAQAVHVAGHAGCEVRYGGEGPCGKVTYQR